MVNRRECTGLASDEGLDANVDVVTGTMRDGCMETEKSRLDPGIHWLEYIKSITLTLITISLHVI